MEKKQLLIEVKSLKMYFHTDEGVVRAVDGVDLTIEREKTLAIVGESGCGKSVTALTIMGLVPCPPGKVEGGEILYHRNGEVINLTKLNPRGPEMRSIRGNEIAMIFQEPMTSLNPVYTIGDQIVEAITLHQRLSKKDALGRAIEMLQAVGIPSPEQRVHEYPFELSGGMRQRAMIAMALSCDPSLLIADEPTTALDVTIQAQVLELMAELRSKLKNTILFITHNLGIVAKMADYVVVMYFGRVVESAGVLELFQKPMHPYTRGLLNSIPSLYTPKGERLTPVEGVVPDPLESVSGCAFVQRCRHAHGICRKENPVLREVQVGHYVSCWRNDG